MLKRMMSQSEIDAGPPNKKPKMGSLNSMVSVGGIMSNGLSTQMSETTGKCLNMKNKKKL
jgi:hypothetical protein